jgi:nucleoside-diphosphate-sugar epimerase
MKKVLITGATGFIGSHLVARNLKAGNRVRVLSLSDDPEAENLRTRGIEVVFGDIRDRDAVRRAVKGMQIVFHLAAVVTDWAPRKLFEEVNVGGMRNICEACLENHVERLVEISTNDVFGLKEGIVMDETFDFEYWGEPYSDSKLDATRVLQAFMGK